MVYAEKNNDFYCNSLLVFVFSIICKKTIKIMHLCLIVSSRAIFIEKVFGLMGY